MEMGDVGEKPFQPLALPAFISSAKAATCSSIVFLADRTLSMRDAESAVRSVPIMSLPPLMIWRPRTGAAEAGAEAKELGLRGLYRKLETAEGRTICWERKTCQNFRCIVLFILELRCKGDIDYMPDFV